MKKISAVILAVLLISILAVGCAPKTNAPTQEQNTTLPAEGQKEDGNVNQEVKDEEKENSNELSNELIEAEGIYEGRVDNNFIEIKLETAENPVEFNIMEIADSFGEFDAGSKVKITYVVDENNQNILKSIEKVN